MKTSKLHGSSKLLRSHLFKRAPMGLLSLLLLIGGGVLVWRTFAPASDPAPAEMAQGFPSS